MRKDNTLKLGEAIETFFQENKELGRKILEIRAQRGWYALLGPMSEQYTRNIYVRDRVMYVSLSSSVYRSELELCSDRLLKSLNEYVGEQVIDKLVIR